MKFSIITLFPEVFRPVLESSILGRAVKKGLVDFQIIDLRLFGEGSHKTVDDKTYGGGVGMVLRSDVLSKALSAVTNNLKNNQPFTILTSAPGDTYDQSLAKKLSKLDHIIIVCGHYEGVDQRFIDQYVDQEISIGDYILTGGEIPAMVIVDSVTRLIEGVLEKKEAIEKESFENNLLEHPHYTRPVEWIGKQVPKVLLSGDHKKIEDWRLKKAIQMTKKKRPQLYLKFLKSSKK